MAILLNDRVAFLEKQHIFSDTDPSFLPQIAERMEEFTLTKNSNLYTEGDKGHHLYFIYEGNIQLWQEEDGEIRINANLEIGDKFGEEALLLEQPRSSTATAKENCYFLSLDLSDFTWLINQFPEVKENLIALAFSHHQSRKQNFDWLVENESIYLLTNRHPVDLWIGLLKPLAIILLGVFLYFSTSIFPSFSSIPIIGGNVLLGLGVLWAIWEGIDWKNDYFIITNKRVIWLEQILFQSASRQEAPMSAIQSINIHTSYFGRLLDYGTVTIRTFTGLGSLTLTNLKNPKRFKENIQELLLRVRDRGDQAQSDRIRQTIRQSLGYEVEEPINTKIGILDIEKEASRKQKVFKTRQFDGENITYHKHWWVLFSKTWVAILWGIGLLTFIIYQIVESILIESSSPLSTSFYLLIGLISVFLFLVMAYHYVDWKNDVYNLTEDSIIDSEHKPFGSENTQTASLANIQSIQNTRKGILRLILNFGSVNIMISDALFTFVDVPNPAQVQQDIYYKQEQLKFNEKEESDEEERQRMASWISAYHEVQENENIPPPAPPSFPALENEEEEY